MRPYLKSNSSKLDHIKNWVRNCAYSLLKPMSPFKCRAVDKRLIDDNSIECISCFPFFSLRNT